MIKETINVKETTTIKELKTFWSNIWIHKTSYSKKAKWFGNIKDTNEKIMNHKCKKILQ